MKFLNKTLFVAIIFVGIILFSQCSPYAGKSVLHFFFDGVPVSDRDSLQSVDYEAITADSIDCTEGALASAESEESTHYPYMEGECASCHNEQALGTMIEPQPGLCYMCHEDLSEQYNYLHGPVAGGYCSACHDPHRSKYKKLLRLTEDPLCFYCHKAESVALNEIHEGLDGMLCTDCHNPHGGDDKYIFQ